MPHRASAQLAGVPAASSKTAPPQLSTSKNDARQAMQIGQATVMAVHALFQRALHSPASAWAFIAGVAPMHGAVGEEAAALFGGQGGAWILKRAVSGCRRTVPLSR